MHMFFSQTAPHSCAEHRNDPIVSFAYPPLASPLLRSERPGIGCGHGSLAQGKPKHNHPKMPPAVRMRTPA